MRIQGDGGIFREIISAIGETIIFFALFSLGKMRMDQEIQELLTGILGKISELEPEKATILASAFVGRVTRDQQALGKEVLKKAGMGEIGLQSLGGQYSTQWFFFLFMAVLLVIFFYAFIDIREQRRNISDIIRLCEDIQSNARPGMEPAKWRKQHSPGMTAIREVCSDAFRIMNTRCLELEKEREELRRYFEDISHQMKTPMTSISLMQEILMEGEQDKEKRELLNRCGQKIEEVQELLISLLQMTRLEVFVTKMNLSRHVVRNTLDQALRSVELLAEDKQVLLIKKGKDTVQAVYDEFWVGEALKNLLKNAIEYSPEGGTVSIEFTAELYWRTFLVRDQGKGIPENMRGTIFQRYVSSYGDPVRGSGVGLNIAWKVARYHGGSLDVIPQKSGTCIRFRIPDNPGKTKYK